MEEMERLRRVVEEAAARQAARDRWITIHETVDFWEMKRLCAIQRTANLAPVCGADPGTIIWECIDWSSFAGDEVRRRGLLSVTFRWRPTPWLICEAAIWPIVPQLPVDQWPPATC